MMKSILFGLLGVIGLSTFSGCVSYPEHRRHDEVIVQPAGYRVDHEHDRDGDHHDQHDDRDHW